MQRRKSLGWRVRLAIAGSLLLTSCGTVTGPSPSTSTAGSAAANSPSPSAELTSTTEPATAAPPGAITVEASGPPPRFTPKDLTVDAGDVVFFYTNVSHGTHTLAIGRSLQAKLTRSDSVRGGQAVTLTVHGLRPGAYVIWCTIGDHAAEGMVGTLTVK